MSALSPARLRPNSLRLGVNIDHVATLPTIRLGMRLFLLTMVRKSELQDAVCRAVQPRNLLRGQTQALHQLDVAERLRRRAGQRRRLGNDHLLDGLDLPAQYRTQHPEQRHGQEVCRRDDPVDAEGVDHDEDDADPLQTFWQLSGQRGCGCGGAAGRARAGA